VRAWLKAAEIADGPVFRRVTQWATVGKHRLQPDAVRQILLKRVAAAGIEGTLLEPITPHGMRTGFITTAYRNGVPDEEIMGHTRHRSLERAAKGLIVPAKPRSFPEATQKLIDEQNQCDSR
jgi:integrase